MTTPDYLQQVVISNYGRSRAGQPAGRGDRYAEPLLTAAIWSGMDFLCATIAGIFAFRIRLNPMMASLHGTMLLRLETRGWFLSMGYLLVFCLYLIAFSRLYGLYRSPDSRSGLSEQRLTVQATLTAGLLLCGTLYLTRAYGVSRIVVALTVLFTMILLMVRRAISRKLRERSFLQGRETRNVLIVGDGRVGHALRNHLQALPHMGFRFLGFVSLDRNSSSNTQGSNSQVIGDISNCVALARSLFVDEIYFSTPVEKQTVISVVEEARSVGIDVRVVPDLYDGLAWNAPVEFIGQFPTIPLHRRDFPRGAFFVKRVMDVAVAIVAMILLAPFMLIVALLVRLDSPGPIFYRASRIGRKGRTFTCYKLRTMVQDAEKLQQDLAHRNERDGVLFKISNDPRVTKIGVWLRKYSLDELPQFFNVLTGDMSLVGPRPPLASEVEKYDLAHLRRLDVLPGMTGLWQVEARQDPSFDSYISLDTAYVENWNLLLDLRILARTVGVVVAGTGT
jgi:exopolysaccharide biosynthesis polyprenyl glycosylphosphotransferase